MKNVIPEDFPRQALMERAAAVLSEQFHEEVVEESRMPMRCIGFMTLLLLVAAFLDTVTGPFTLLGVEEAAHLSRLCSFLELGLFALLLALLLRSGLVGTRLQKNHQRTLRELECGVLCPLTIVQGKTKPARGVPPSIP